MTPLVFIIIVATILILLVYWVLNTLKDSKPTRLRPDRFKYEFARELTMDGETELFLPKDSIKISGEHASYVWVYWNLSKEKWEETTSELGLSPSMDRLRLRLYEANDWLQYYDIRVKTIAGKFRLELQPEIAYYICLGFKNKDQFIPVLTSNTVKKPK